MKVEVVYARAEGARVASVSLPAGATLRDAVAASNLLGDPEGYSFGVFGKRAALDHPLAEGDRVEIYRPLAMDPKEARRRRAKREAQNRAKRQKR